MNSFALMKDETGTGPAASPVASGFEIHRLPGQINGYELVMKGSLAPGWTGRLTAALAEQRIGIVRGSAEKVTASSWQSRFELQAGSFARNPLALDFSALAARELPASRQVARISLLEFAMEAPGSGDDSLYIEVTGADRLGFLGDLLDYFSMRCLFPVKMSVETVGELAVDRFWLKGVGGSRPSDSITAAIRENLNTLLITKA